MAQAKYRQERRLQIHGIWQPDISTWEDRDYNFYNPPYRQLDDIYNTTEHQVYRNKCKTRFSKLLNDFCGNGSYISWFDDKKSFSAITTGRAVSYVVKPG